MSRRHLALVAAVSTAAASLSVLTSSASAATQYDFEDGTTQTWGPSFNTPWPNPAVNALGATDGGQAYNFNIPPGFTFGGQSLVRPNGFGAADPAEGARWDNFVASNLMLVDLSVEGTKPADSDASPTLQAQYVAMWPALNGRGPASGLPSLDGAGNKTYTFIGSFDRPIDLDTGSTARYQLAFSPGYFTGVRTHTFAWDYVNAGYDFSLLTPTADDQNYTILHYTTNTDCANPFAGRVAMDNVRVYRAKSTDPTYNGPATGGAFAASNFANGFVSGAGAISIFKKIDGADTATVNVSSNVTVGTLMLNNAPRSNLLAIIPGNPTSYTFAGASTLTIDGGTREGAIVAVDGDNVISAPLSLQSNTVIDLAADPSQDGVPAAPASLAVGNVTLAAGKTLRTTSIGSLTVNGNLIGGAGSSIALNGAGRTSLVGSSRRIATGSLAIGSKAQLDVGSGSVTVNYDGSTPFATLYGAAISGFAAGTNTGTGIVTTAAGRTVGIVEASSVTLAGNSFLGQVVDGTTILIRSTFAGDFDLSGLVEFADLVVLAQNYQGTGTLVWRQGDTNYDGQVNFADLVSLAQNYQRPLTLEELSVLGSDVAADWALAQSLVPEPTTLVTLAAVSAMALRRRRDC